MSAKKQKQNIAAENVNKKLQIDCCQTNHRNKKLKIMSLRDVREQILFAHNNGVIDDEEFIALFDLNRSRNPDFPYWKYDPFDLDKLSDDECLAMFRFLKNDIYNLADVFQLPDKIYCPNRQNFDKVEALCILLRRFAYPSRLGDLISLFGRSVPELSNVVSTMTNYIYWHFGHLLTDMNQPWLSRAKLADYANAIHQAGAALENCWAFVDGTVRPCSRPGENQRVVYNGHKRIHAIKFQSLVTPNGMIAQLHGPFEGKKHDSSMLVESGLYNQLMNNSFSPNGDILCIYGDPAYPLRAHLQRPFQGARLTPLQSLFNKSMSSVRVSVEWVFGDIVNYFKFLDYKKNLKLGLSPIGKMYLVCGLLHNARTILYDNTTAKYFNYVEKPTLENYFQ
ncbi:uncharacterized protein [Clytia hemisphaerica]|uniref:uncharacterized protein n=1 Tax=Clytia hemisphaerica TaxID=252671 RepID=UPI0034D48B21